MKFLGVPYPIIPHPRGYLHSTGGISQIKADLLQLLLTNPGERVMLPTYGTPLKKFIFEQNDTISSESVRQAIINSINLWEPRITVQEITVKNGANESQLNPQDAKEDLENIMSITIKFFDPENIQEVDAVVLELPVGGVQ